MITRHLIYKEYSGFRFNKSMALFLLMCLTIPSVFSEDVSTETKELIQARQEYRRQVKIVIEPQKDKYLKQLEEMKKKLGAKGDLDGAMSIQNEIKDISAKTSNDILNMIGLKKDSTSNIGDNSQKDSEGDTGKKKKDDIDSVDIFQNKKWVNSLKVKAGEYTAGTETIIIVNDTNKPAPIISIEPGAIIKDGKIFIQQGQMIAKKAKFVKIEFSVELGGSFEAADCVFENCSFGKGGGWFVAWWSSKWKFKNCIFTDRFFNGWDSGSVGIMADNCSFYGITFPTFNYRDDAGAESQNEWRTIKECRFVNCSLPESVLAATKSSLFENCDFPPDKDYNYKTAVNVTMYSVDPKGDLPGDTGNLKFNVVKNSKTNKAKRGSSLKYDYKKNE